MGGLNRGLVATEGSVGAKLEGSRRFIELLKNQMVESEGWGWIPVGTPILPSYSCVIGKHREDVTVRHGAF